MAAGQITEQQRIQRIREEVAAARKQPPDKQTAIDLIQVGASERSCPVILFPVDDVLLNPNSHRLRSQLQGDPEWTELEKQPHSEKAQQLLERYIRGARTAEQFRTLRESLEKNGQEYAGIMTYKGVLINANTRAVALRDLTDHKKRYVKAAVLPEDVKDSDLALLELRLQMQKDLKEPYSLTNELLFIEEMYTKFHTPPKQIAEDLRFASGKRGENEVKLRMKLLIFIRQLQEIPAEPLKLRFFDEAQVKLQHLKDLNAKYELLAAKDMTAAHRLLENWLLSVRVGLTAVHKLREVDQDFDSDYLLPQLKQEPGIGDFVDSLTSGAQTNGQPTSSGVQALLGGSATAASAPSAAGNLLNLLTRDDKRIEVTKPGAKNPVQFDQSDVLLAVKSATFDGVSHKQGDDREDNKQEAPVKAIKDATQSLDKAVTALSKVHDESDYDQSRKATFVAAVKRHRKTLKNAETQFANLGVPID